AFAAALGARNVPEGAAGASHLAALAHHATAAHDLPRALPAWIGAARATFRASAFAEASRAYERATELWDAVPASQRPADEDHVQLLYDAAGALLVEGDTTRASDMARMAVELFDETSDPVKAARLRERLGWAVYLAGDLPGGTRLLEE